MAKGKKKKTERRTKSKRKPMKYIAYWCNNCDNPATVCTCILMMRDWVEIKTEKEEKNGISKS